MNVLIIGFGSIAKKHLDALRSLNIDIKIWALRSNKKSKATEGIISIYNYNEIPLNIDFAIISNPTNKHISTIKKLIPLNIPLFIEKPITHSLINLDDTLSLIKDNNVTTYVACVLRFHPCLQYVKERMSLNTLRINEVNVYCGSYLPDWRVNTNYKNNYSAKVSEGGGVHLDLFHEIDYTLWLFGFPLNSSKTLESKSSIDINSYDSANYIFKYEEFNVNMVLNYFRKTPKRKIEIVFSDKIWEIDLIKGTVIENEEIELFNSELSIIDLYKIQLSYFIDCINQQKDAENNFEASSKILKYCLQDE